MVAIGRRASVLQGATVNNQVRRRAAGGTDVARRAAVGHRTDRERSALYGRRTSVGVNAAGEHERAVADLRQATRTLNVVTSTRYDGIRIQGAVYRKALR